MKLTNQAQKALDDSKRLSKRLKQNYTGTEHLLVGLVRQKDSMAAKLLANVGVNEQAVIGLIEELISPGEGVAILDRDGFTPRMEQLIEQANQEAASCGMQEVGTEHMLLAMLRLQDSAAVSYTHLTLPTKA